jgi:hypothetical protein
MGRPMNEPKPFASLSSGLLARKGGAKPAMRPQMFGQVPANLEDLGWDDMGDVPAPREPSSIAALTPAPVAVQPVELEPEQEQEQEQATEAVSVPPVVEQQRAIESSFALPPAQVEEEARKAPPALPGKSGRAKCAFTLRLDADRHLRLRLACAVQHRSAQRIVTDALDAYLNSQPGLAMLAGQVPPQAVSCGQED